MHSFPGTYEKSCHTIVRESVSKDTQDPPKRSSKTTDYGYEGISQGSNNVPNFGSKQSKLQFI